MASKVPTSFVPKQPVRTVRRPKGRGSLNIFSVIGLVILLAAIGLAAATFGYQLYLTQAKEARTEELEELKASIDLQEVEELTQLSQRLETAEVLLEDHVISSQIFALLEQHTVEGVQFEDFTMNMGGNGAIELSMTGRAQNFNVLAFQSETMGESEAFRNQLFSDIAVAEDEAVTFMFQATVDSAYVQGNVTNAPIIEESFEEGVPDAGVSTSSDSSVDNAEIESTTSATSSIQ